MHVHPSEVRQHLLHALHNALTHLTNMKSIVDKDLPKEPCTCFVSGFTNPFNPSSFGSCAPSGLEAVIVLGLESLAPSTLIYQQVTTVRWEQGNTAGPMPDPVGCPVTAAHMYECTFHVKQ